MFEALLALMLSDKLGDRNRIMPPRDPAMDGARNEIRDGLVAALGGNGRAPTTAKPL